MMQREIGQTCWAYASDNNSIALDHWAIGADPFQLDCTCQSAYLLQNNIMARKIGQTGLCNESDSNCNASAIGAYPFPV